MHAAHFAIRFALVGLTSWNAAGAADWPGFRGGQFGHSTEQDARVSDSEQSILWKTKLPGPGASSPITVGGKVFLTCYTGYGEKLSKGFTPPPGDKKGPPPAGGRPFPPLDGPDEGGDQKALRLHVLCLDAKTGDNIWEYDVEPNLPEAKFAGMIKDHGYASSTPVSDGQHLYAFFGHTGVICFDLNGKKIWQTSVGSNTDAWGSASSPILYKDLLIVNAAIESRSLVALDKMTGKEVWRTPGTDRTWSSPILVQSPEGRDELVVSLTGRVVSFDPSSGKELWRCEGIGAGGRDFPPMERKDAPPDAPKDRPFIEPYTVSTPVARDGIVYLVGGGGPTRPIAMAVRSGGTGDVNETHVLWRKPANELLGSPVLVGDSLCWVSGVLTAIDIKDGKPLAKERLCGNFTDYTSPVTAGDKVYALTRFDGLFVVAGEKEFEKVACLKFPEEEGVFSSAPALSNGKIYVRSNAYLYCVGAP